MTRYYSKFVHVSRRMAGHTCSRSFKKALAMVQFDFLVVLHCNYVSSSHRFQMLLLISQNLKRSCDSEHIARRFVSKFVLRFARYASYKGFKEQKWPSRSFNGIGNYGAIR